MFNEYQKHYLEHCGDSTTASTTLPDSHNPLDLKAPVVRVLPRYGTTVTPILVDSFLSNQYELKNGLISISLSPERSDTSSIGTMGKSITYTYKITLAPFHLPKLYEDENRILGIDIGSTDVSQFSYNYVAIKVVGFDTQGVSTVGNLINPLQFHFLCDAKFDPVSNYYTITPVKEFEELVFSTPQTYINSIKLELSNGFRTLELPRCKFENVTSGIFDSVNIAWNNHMSYNFYGELILGYNLQRYRQSDFIIQAPVILNNSGIMEFINLGNNINTAINFNFNLSKYLDISGGFDDGYYEMYNKTTIEDLKSVFTNLAKFTRVKYYAYNDIVYYNPLVPITAIKNSNIYYDSYNSSVIKNNIYNYLNTYRNDYYISNIKVENYNKLIVTIHNTATTQDILLYFLYGSSSLHNIFTIYKSSTPIEIISNGEYSPNGWFVQSATTTNNGFVLYTSSGYPINNVYIDFTTNAPNAPNATYTPTDHLGSSISVITSNNENNINVLSLQSECKYKIFFNQIYDPGAYVYLETEIDDYLGYSVNELDIDWTNLKYNSEILATTTLQNKLLTWYITYLRNNVYEVESYKDFIDSSRVIYKINSPYWIINDQADFYWDTILYSDSDHTTTINGGYLALKKNRTYNPILFSFVDPSTIPSTIYFTGEIKGTTVDIPDNSDDIDSFTVGTWVDLNNGLWYAPVSGLSTIVNRINNIEFIKLSMDNMIICDQRILMMMKMTGYNVNTPITNGCLAIG